MDIRFGCDQCGSRFRVGEIMAGKGAKCPKCDAELTVPDITDVSSLASEVEDSKIQQSARVSEAPEGQEEADGGSSLATGAEEDMIVFLCPNGHELHSPARLQGKPGACPHCKARFQIPDYDEEEVEEADVFSTEEFPESDNDSDIDSGIIDFHVDFPSDPLAGGGTPQNQGLKQTARGPQPIKSVFTWLWKQKGNLGTVEIHLKDNSQVLKAKLFAEARSQGDCALFAIEEGDGSFTVSTVPWENISHVVLRDLEDIDEDAFEEPDPAEG